MNKIRKKPIALFMIMVIIFACFSTLIFFSSEKTVKADTDIEEKIELRFVYTTDNHGQLNSTNYELGTEYVGGLAKAYTLLKEAKAEKNEENVFMFDVGDTMYDSTTEYIFANAPDELQPIFNAMSLIEYDAIVLGNHDFDYGYDYIMKQMNLSGLINKCVVSNVKSPKGDGPFLENMIIEREVKTNLGNTAMVKIGIIGVTPPNLSSKNGSYDGYLESEDIIQCVTRQSELLKEQGVDIVVVLSHSGAGPEQPEEKYKNCSYAITKIPDVDVVLCGHEHVAYPSNDTTPIINTLPGVDKNTKLVNGKLYVMSKSRGQTIGIADMTLQTNDDGYEIIEQSGQVREVTKETLESSKIKDLFGDWAKVFQERIENRLINIEHSDTIENYFGLIEDTSIMQLTNESKISFAMQYINTKAKQYQKYPIIATSSYTKYGETDTDDYAELSGDISETDLANFQPYNSNVSLYKMTGAQLVEWLEWTASAYETIGKSTTWEEDTMNNIIKTSGLQSIIAEDWLYDWSKFKIIDGVNYTINPTKPPRYNKGGNKISDSRRVEDITYNGEKVTNNMEFILVSNKITKSNEVLDPVEKQVIYKSGISAQKVLEIYLDKLSSAGGSISPEPDYNWSINLPSDKSFIVAASSKSSSFMTRYDFIDNLIDSIDGFNYYKSSIKSKEEKKLPPTVILSTSTDDSTKNAIEVYVNAISNSNTDIKTIRYTKGVYNDVNDDVFKTAATVKNKKIEVTENDTFTFYVEDKNGNKAIKSISISNYDNGVLNTPTIKKVTNRDTQIKGNAEANATLYIKASNKTYTVDVPSTGSYKCNIAAQPAGTVLTLYSMDKYGNKSQNLNYSIKRNGPDKPKVNKIYNTSTKVKGTLTDSVAVVFAKVGETIYLDSSEEALKIFEASEIYNPDFNIIRTNATIKDDLTYSIKINPYDAGKKIVVYSIEYTNNETKRVSPASSKVVVEKGPNPPTINDAYNIENEVSGNITQLNENEVYDIFVNVNGVDYQTTSLTDGSFKLKLNSTLKQDDVIKSYAQYMEDDELKKSATSSTTVISVEDLYFTENIICDDITTDDTSISGTYDPNELIYISHNGNIYKTYIASGTSFYIDLGTNFDLEDKIYVYTRYDEGDINDICELKVELGEPSIPYLLEGEIINIDTQVQLAGSKYSTIALKIGDKIYKSSDCVYDNVLETYVFNIDIPQISSGTEVSFYAYNEVGETEETKTTVIALVPDEPQVDEVSQISEKVTGYININNYNDLERGIELTAFAKIGKDVFAAKVDQNGYFEIETGPNIHGAKITVWISNMYGQGLPTKVTVTE